MCTLWHCWGQCGLSYFWMFVLSFLFVLYNEDICSKKKYSLQMDFIHHSPLPKLLALSINCKDTFYWKPIIIYLIICFFPPRKLLIFIRKQSHYYLKAQYLFKCLNSFFHQQIVLLGKLLTEDKLHWFNETVNGSAVLQLEIWKVAGWGGRALYFFPRFKSLPLIYNASKYLFNIFYSHMPPSRSRSDENSPLHGLLLTIAYY